MRFISVVLVALAIQSTSGNALAQTSERPHSLKQGTWAVLYQLDGVRLSFFNGMLAFKYHLTDRRALRFGIGGNVATNSDRQDLNGGISSQAHYVLYLHPEREVKFYLGAGPYIGYSLSRSDGDSTRRRHDARWTIGIGGRLGTEWFATKSISVLAEFGNLLSASILRAEDGAIEERTWRDYSYGSTVTVGLSVYL